MMNIEDAISRARAAQGDAHEMTLAAVDIVLSAFEPELRLAAEAASIPHWFTPAILARLLEIDLPAAEHLFLTLNRLPLVEPFAARGAANVHQATRVALRAELVKRDAGAFRRLSARAAACFRAETAHEQVEHLYHLLCAADDNAGHELDRLYQTWYDKGRTESLQILGTALADLLNNGPLSEVNRAWALLIATSIYYDYRPASESAEAAEEAARLFESLEMPEQQADAHFVSGLALLRQGRPRDALKQFERTRDVYAELSSRAPDDAELLRSLAASWWGLALVAEYGKDEEKALEQRVEFRRLSQRLADLDPENATWQKNLAVAHNSIGEALRRLNRLNEAQEEYAAYNRIMIGLTEADAENLDWKHELAVSHTNLSEVLAGQQGFFEALHHATVARNNIIPLTAIDPDRTDWQYTSFLAYRLAGRSAEGIGAVTSALEEYIVAEQILQRLTAQDPANEDWQQALTNIQAELRRVSSDVASREA